MLSNMASSLILHKRIETTVAKAKAVKQFVEPLVTKSKEDTTHSRRIVFSYLKQKEAVTELFRTIAPKIADRPGGYTRILKTGFRLGDAADMCIIEFVDFNEAYTLVFFRRLPRRNPRPVARAVRRLPMLLPKQLRPLKAARRRKLRNRLPRSCGCEAGCFQAAAGAKKVAAPKVAKKNQRGQEDVIPNNVGRKRTVFRHRPFSMVPSDLNSFFRFGSFGKIEAA